jgi:hypothetical protein
MRRSEDSIKMVCENVELIHLDEDQDDLQRISFVSE